MTSTSAATAPTSSAADRRFDRLAPSGPGPRGGFGPKGAAVRVHPGTRLVVPLWDTIVGGVIAVLTGRGGVPCATRLKKIVPDLKDQVRNVFANICAVGRVGLEPTADGL